MIVKNKGLQGTIKKENGVFNFNVTIQGWGNTNLYTILKNINVISKIENLSNGQKVEFQN